MVHYEGRLMEEIKDSDCFVLRRGLHRSENVYHYLCRKLGISHIKLIKAIKSCRI